MKKLPLLILLCASVNAFAGPKAIRVTIKNSQTGESKSDSHLLMAEPPTTSSPSNAYTATLGDGSCFVDLMDSSTNPEIKEEIVSIVLFDGSPENLPEGLQMRGTPEIHKGATFSASAGSFSCEVSVVK